MMRRQRARIVLGLLIGCSAWPVAAAIYDEGVDGDLSGTPPMPTAFALEAGANTITGAAGPAATEDFDLVALTIPTGYRLDSLMLTDYQLNVGQSFIGLMPGATWTTGLGGDVSPTPLIGWALFDTTLIGTNLLDDMSDAFPQPRFTPPLGAGTYTLVIQDTQEVFNYVFTFNVSAVPEPASTALVGTSILMAAIRRRLWLEPSRR